MWSERDLRSGKEPWIGRWFPLENVEPCGEEMTCLQRVYQCSLIDEPAARS